jgi:hypothetical protein
MSPELSFLYISPGGLSHTCHAARLPNHLPSFPIDLSFDKASKPSRRAKAYMDVPAIDFSTEHIRRSHRPLDYALDRSARAEYNMPPNREGRVASFATRWTPASVKSWRSRSNPTGYGPHLFGLDRSYSTIKKRSVADRSLFRNTCCSWTKWSVFAMRIPSTGERRRLGLPISPSVLRISTPS